MPDGVDPSTAEASSVRPVEGNDQLVVESYETEEGTVFYDAWNPMAWIESSVTVTVAEVN